MDLRARYDVVLNGVIKATVNTTAQNYSRIYSRRSASGLFLQVGLGIYLCQSSYVHIFQGESTKTSVEFNTNAQTFIRVFQCRAPINRHYISIVTDSCLTRCIVYMTMDILVGLFHSSNVLFFFTIGRKIQQLRNPGQQQSACHRSERLFS